MAQAKIPENENGRLSALYEYDLLDRKADAIFETIIRIAADVCDVEISVCSPSAPMGVQPHIIERVLNHSSGTISGVAAVYNRFHYQDETKAALLLWHDKIKSLSVNTG